MKKRQNKKKKKDTHFREGGVAVGILYLFFHRSKQDLTCMMCKTPLPEIIFTSNASQSFEVFNLGMLPLEPSAGGLCAEKATQKYVQRLFARICPLCGPEKTFKVDSCGKSQSIRLTLYSRERSLQRT